MKRSAVTRFTAAEQRWFAKFSGDANPVHLDPIVSRRVAAGEPIVHGVHLVLRALDMQAPKRFAARPARLSARFLKPAVLNEPLQLATSRAGALEMRADGDVTLVELTLAQASKGSGQRVSTATDPTTLFATRRGGDRRTPAVRTLADLADASGSVQRRRGAQRAFPRASRAIGADVVGALAAISQIVGMECPGRDSLLSAIDLRFTPHAPEARLQWRVQRVDRRFGLVRVAIRGENLEGTVDAFLRPQPSPAPSVRAAAERVARGEFAGQRALIVGGSRGLGAATAVLIAAGGGVPVVTYASGAGDATALQRDAAAVGARIETSRLDVTDDPTARIRALGRSRITHLYYFATPRIFARRQPPFDDALFARFARFYVSGFVQVCTGLQSIASNAAAFYPSSTAIDERLPDLMEYVAAKTAGEAAAQLLAHSMPGLQVLVRRLPRIATDQTASFVAAPASDPFDVLLPIIREMHRLGTRREP